MAITEGGDIPTIRTILTTRPTRATPTVRTIAHFWIRPGFLCARPGSGWTKSVDVFPKEHFTGSAQRLRSGRAMAPLRPSARSGNTRLFASNGAAFSGKRAGSHLQRLFEGRPMAPLRPSAHSGNTRLFASSGAAFSGKRADPHLQRLPGGAPVMLLFGEEADGSRQRA